MLDIQHSLVYPPAVITAGETVFFAWHKRLFLFVKVFLSEKVFSMPEPQRAASEKRRIRQSVGPGSSE